MTRGESGPAARRPARVILVQTAVGDYRQAVFEHLIQECQGEFHIFAGADYFDPTVKTGVNLGPHLSSVNNHFLLGRRLLFQTGMWRPLLFADVAILEFNPRIVSVWLALVLRRLRNKRSVLWGHAWPRAGRRSRTKILRKAMGWLCDTILVYTETQAVELRRYLPHKRIIAAPNAIYSGSAMGAGGATPTPAAFIYVGRLVPDKKPDLLLQAFALATDRLPAQARLIFVGDGPLRASLGASVGRSAVSARVAFAGHVSDLDELRRYYAESVASVSPGYVGLSITQSFSFGVPMIISRHERHAPEIEAAVEGRNAVFFASDRAPALADALVAVWDDRDRWLSMRDAISADCAARYSVELMAERILEATHR